jgi:ribosome maturation factor RimP
MSGGSRHVAVRPERLAGVLEPVIRAAGLELESVRAVRAGRGSLLRVVVDSDQGVSLDDIAEVSRAVAARIDASDVMGSGPYTLEVSSPGVDRPLTEPRHWRRASGRLVRVSVAGGPGENGRLESAPSSSLTPQAGHPGTVEGRIIEAGPDAVTLEVDGELREFGYAGLGPGQVQVEFGKPAGDRVPAGDTDLAGGAEPDGH